MSCVVVVPSWKLAVWCNYNIRAVMCYDGEDIDEMYI